MLCLQVPAKHANVDANIPRRELAIDFSIYITHQNRPQRYKLFCNNQNIFAIFHKKT